MFRTGPRQRAPRGHQARGLHG